MLLDTRGEKGQTRRNELLGNTWLFSLGDDESTVVALRGMALVFKTNYSYVCVFHFIYR
jgi:hypothetical protein